MTQSPSDNVPVASAEHHKILLDAGYTFDSTTTTSYTDRSQTTSSYSKKSQSSGSGDPSSCCGDSDSVSVTKDTLTDEPIWRRSWYDSKGQWQDMSGSSADALSKAIKA
jgi:hypothetical protein